VATVGASPEVLQATLTRARNLGLLGPGPIEPHLRHARGFAAALREAGVPDPPSRVLDLGSGGGLPGLVLATDWPAATVVLLDAGERRAEFLRSAVVECGLGDRVEVWAGRAEAIGHEARARGAFDVVVARSFGPPPVTAECAAPLLRTGGVLVVSAPPAGAGEDRWSVEGLFELGLSAPALVEGEFAYWVLEQNRPCPERFARRVGVPVKRPLF
jgi:16S rRNA (guanine527-N7)-methyltransferase